MHASFVRAAEYCLFACFSLCTENTRSSNYLKWKTKVCVCEWGKSERLSLISYLNASANAYPTSDGQRMSSRRRCICICAGSYASACEPSRHFFLCTFSGTSGTFLDFDLRKTKTKTIAIRFRWVKRDIECDQTNRYALAYVSSNWISSEIASGTRCTCGIYCCGDFRVRSIVPCIESADHTFCTRTWIHLWKTKKIAMEMITCGHLNQYTEKHSLVCFRACFRKPISAANTRSHSLQRNVLFSCVCSWYCKCDCVTNCLPHRPHSYGFGWLLSQ